MQVIILRPEERTIKQPTIVIVIILSWEATKSVIAYGQLQVAVASRSLKPVVAKDSCIYPIATTGNRQQWSMNQLQYSLGCSHAARSRHVLSARDDFEGVDTRQDGARLARHQTTPGSNAANSQDQLQCGHVCLRLADVSAAFRGALTTQLEDSPGLLCRVFMRVCKVSADHQKKFRGKYQKKFN